MVELMKIQRPGYSESTILCLDYIFRNFIQYLDDQQQKYLKKDMQQNLSWLFTTSGFYDKSISIVGSKRLKKTNLMQFSEYLYEHDTIKKFISTYSRSIKDSNRCKFLLHKMIPEFFDRGYVDKFKDSLNVESEIFPLTNKKFYYQLIRDKRLLVINSFASLCSNQYISGNLRKIDPDFPRLSNIAHIDTPYSFFNKGPHSNWFETLDYMCNKVQEKKFDLAIIGYGSYSAPLCHFIHSEMKLGAICAGSFTNKLFGVDPDAKGEFYINNIPRRFIPANYLDIENGRYWIGNKPK